MKYGVADYGMNVWYGGLYDIEERLLALRDIGYNGTERLEATGPSDAIHKAAMYRKLGMDFSTCRGPSMQNGIEWTSALGRSYVWLTVEPNNRDIDFSVYCRRANDMARACARWGIKLAVHNHMHQRVETQKELEDFLKACPDVGIVFDTGHLSCAGGDPAEIARKYHSRICVMHLKDVRLDDPARGLDATRRGYKFCELGAGNNGFSNASVLKALRDARWDGWLHVEHDDHVRDPLVDLKTSLRFIKDNL
jgi:sugar phosphate isomerase/epimerase